MRKLLKAGVLGMVLALCGGAFALAAAPSQYGPSTTPTPVTPQGTVTTPPPATAPTTPATSTPPVTATDDAGSDTAGDADSGESDSDTADDTDTGADGGDAVAPATPTGAGQRAAGDARNCVSILLLGVREDSELAEDIDEAIVDAGLDPRPLTATAKTTKDWLASDEAKAFADGGPKATGRAFGAQLTSPTPAVREAFATLFGADTPFVCDLRAAIALPRNPSDDLRDFALGVAEGLKSADRPVAYTERSDRKESDSFIDDFTKIEVNSVDNVDEPAGKRRLIDILLERGDFTRTGDSPIFIDPDNASATFVDSSENGGVAGAAIGLLALLAAGALFVFTSRRRRTSAG